MKCACVNCLCVVSLVDAIEKDQKYYCSASCADGSCAQNGCGHKGCGCN